MKTISTILVILFSSQFALANLSTNSPNCDKQAKNERHVNVQNCNFNFSNLYPSCAGKDKTESKGAVGTDSSTPRSGS